MPYDDLTNLLLAKRGITTKEEAETFLNPSYDAHLIDPLLIKDMEKAAKRLASAILSGERICAWTDYDCDGTPAAVILHDFLEKVGANFEIYIPHRHEEGYGVNTAGITEQHFDAAFSLNTRGTLFAVQKALPLFNDGGSIFMTGSVASVKGYPGYGVYAASKAALRSFARTWLNELKDRNIRVNVLSPGPIATPKQDQVLDEEAKRMFESQIPRGKMGRPEEIASAALFLASDDSSFVNGVELSVDGGLSAI